ncbi:DUF4403 family protein [Pontibacter pamirensis]|uniref:DUF4403 family protein n=1 Tax=Pontibacter pamirensis TaxID=2562824 RepID=UPI00138A37E5|nr:DUF4403 family protein [Pontibacter pamirensis]
MENAIKIHLPVSVSYPALEGLMQKKMVGDFIPRPEAGVDTPPYAQILDVGLAGSSTGDNDVILRIKLKILRTVLKRDQVDLYVLATLGYDNAAQQLFVRKFSMDAKTSSGFYNTALEVLVNKVAYNQIIKKARVNLSEIISAELLKANGMLETGLDLKGNKLVGAVQEVRVQHVMPQPKQVSLSFELLADLKLEVLDLISLMPPK